MLSETKSMFLEEGLFHTHLWAGVVEQSVEASNYLIMALRAATSLLSLQIFDSPATGLVLNHIIKDLCSMSSDPKFLPKLEVLVGNRSVSLESLQENRPIKFLYFHELFDVATMEIYPSLGKRFGASPTTRSTFLEQAYDLSATEIGALIGGSKCNQLSKCSYLHFTVRFPEAIKIKGRPPIPNLLVWLQEVIRVAKLSANLRWLSIISDPFPSHLSASTQYKLITGLSELFPQLMHVRMPPPFFTWHRHRHSLNVSQDLLPLWTPEPSQWNIDWWFEVLRLSFTGTGTQEEAAHIAEQLKEGMCRRYGPSIIPPVETLVNYILNLNP